MKPRIIAGEWRGRTLEVPPGDATRPTAARAREALFSMLASRLGGFEGLRVLDLFAGSGALGLEALSRGAVHARFVEAYPAPRRALQRNIATLGAEARCEVLALRVETLASAPAPHDLVFVDPPYHMGLAAAAIGRLAGGWLASGAIVAVETAHDDVLSGAGAAMVDRAVGRSRLRLFTIAMNAQ